MVIFVFVVFFCCCVLLCSRIAAMCCNTIAKMPGLLANKSLALSSSNFYQSVRYAVPLHNILMRNLFVFSCRATVQNKIRKLITFSHRWQNWFTCNLTVGS
jgi:hypothetical protein